VAVTAMPKKRNDMERWFNCNDEDEKTPNIYNQKTKKKKHNVKGSKERVWLSFFSSKQKRL
jgi:hypothetical protein